ncbi:hypothetical protein ACGFY6_20210 [Streptomyces sp. NPDC048387]|uniref:hypothetical protein n=1 Tax=Streptomyces sp. NPDC048387 TaxID=3365542 RepID=UPI00371C8A28
MTSSAVEDKQTISTTVRRGLQPVADLGPRGDPLVEDCQTLQRDPQDLSERGA